MGWGSEDQEGADVRLLFHLGKTKRGQPRLYAKMPEAKWYLQPEGEWSE